MTKLTKGQEIERRYDRAVFKVVALCDGGYFLKQNGCEGYLFQCDKEIENIFTLPKTRWNPEIGDSYWYICSGLNYSCTTWRQNLFDKTTYELGNCFPTEEKVEAAAEQVKQLLIKLQEE